MITQIKKNITPAQFLDFNGEDEFYREYPRFNANVDKSGIIYTDKKDNCLKVNELMLKKKESDIELYNKMINLNDYGYCAYLADKFERTHKYDRLGNIIKWKYEIYEPEYINIMFTLERYANDKTEFCDKSQKDELVQELAIRKDRRIVKTAKTINERLLQMGIPSI